MDFHHQSSFYFDLCHTITFILVDFIIFVILNFFPLNNLNDFITFTIVAPVTFFAYKVAPHFQNKYRHLCLDSIEYLTHW